MVLVNEYSESMRLQKEASQAQAQAFPRVDPQAMRDARMSLDLEGMEDPEGYLHQ